MGLKEKYIPCGIVEEDRGQLPITFGSSSKTSDFVVDALEAWWAAFDETEQVAMARLQIKMDNGPESSGIRTQFLHRMVQFADQIGKPIHLLYYPPYHSKYNPIERCWGILELHWNGTKLVDVETMLEWAKSMPWKGIHPVRGAEPQSGSQGHCAWQKSHAGGREPPGTPSGVAQVGYADPSSFCTVMRDILFEKSPKVAGPELGKEKAVRVVNGLAMALFRRLNTRVRDTEKILEVFHRIELMHKAPCGRTLRACMACRKRPKMASA
jgi:DDE family transposase